MKFPFLELELRKVPNNSLKIGHEIMEQSVTKISPMFPAWHCPVLLGFARHVPPVFGPLYKATWMGGKDVEKCEPLAIYILAMVLGHGVHVGILDNAYWTPFTAISIVLSLKLSRDIIMVVPWLSLLSLARWIKRAFMMFERRVPLFIPNATWGHHKSTNELFPSLCQKTTWPT